MFTRRWLVLAGLAASLLTAQDAQPSLQVTGNVKQALTLTADDLAKMPRATVRTTNNGMETVYEGVWLHEVLKKAGVPQGGELRGKSFFRLANSTRPSSTTRFCWPIPRMASPCSARRAGSGWLCRRTNPARDRS